MEDFNKNKRFADLKNANDPQMRYTVVVRNRKRVRELRGRENPKTTRRGRNRTAEDERTM